MSEPIWSPSAARIAQSNLSRFVEEQGLNVRAPDYSGLWRWSVENPEKFWPAVVDFCRLKLSPAEQVLQHPEQMPGARWFAGSTLNFAENLLARAGEEGPAIIAHDESGRRREYSGAQLRAEVARVAAGLKADGVGVGDRVAGFLPNGPSAVIGMLAATSLGAVWSSCSPDFGFNGVLDRFGQIEPKVLLACDGYFYNGKQVDTRAQVAKIAAALPSLKRLLVVPFLNDFPDLSAMPEAVRFEQYGEAGAALTFTPVSFDHPLYIMFSSGTTGKPKCIVHGTGGTLLQHAKEMVLQTDVQPGDRLFFFTTCGWMMWNWLVSGLVAGATVVLYDGSPFAGGPDCLWRLAQTERLTQMGISPKFLSAVQQAGYVPKDQVDLGALRTMLSTGSPLAPEGFDFVYSQVKADVQLASISGGTDIISCFVLGNPWQGVHRGELQGAGLGMAVDVYNDQAEAVAEGGGELVCTKPFPSMPVAFWNDTDGARYRGAYFEHFPGIWHHGDYAERGHDGGFIIQGRSDATLNPGGIRIGTAEIYRVVEAIDGVLESIAVGLRRDGDEEVVLFVRMAPERELDDELVQHIRSTVRAELTPRHVPSRVLACPDIPRTISGKITEIAVRDLIHGRDVKNADALANPEALDFYRQLRL